MTNYVNKDKSVINFGSVAIGNSKTTQAELTPISLKYSNSTFHTHAPFSFKKTTDVNYVTSLANTRLDNIANKLDSGDVWASSGDAVHVLDTLVSGSDVYLLVYSNITDAAIDDRINIQYFTQNSTTGALTFVKTVGSFVGTNLNKKLNAYTLGHRRHMFIFLNYLYVCIGANDGVYFYQINMSTSAVKEKKYTAVASNLCSILEPYTDYDSEAGTAIIYAIGQTSGAAYLYDCEFNTDGSTNATAVGAQALNTTGVAMMGNESSTNFHAGFGEIDCYISETADSQSRSGFFMNVFDQIAYTGKGPNQVFLRLSYGDSEGCIFAPVSKNIRTSFYQKSALDLYAHVDADLSDSTISIVKQDKSWTNAWLDGATDKVKPILFETIGSLTTTIPDNFTIKMNYRFIESFVDFGDTCYPMAFYNNTVKIAHVVHQNDNLAFYAMAYDDSGLVEIFTATKAAFHFDPFINYEVIVTKTNTGYSVTVNGEDFEVTETGTDIIYKAYDSITMFETYGGEGIENYARVNIKDVYLASETQDLLDYNFPENKHNDITFQIDLTETEISSAVENDYKEEAHLHLAGKVVSDVVEQPIDSIRTKLIISYTALVSDRIDFSIYIYNTVAKTFTLIADKSFKANGFTSNSTCTFNIGTFVYPVYSETLTSAGSFYVYTGFLDTNLEPINKLDFDIKFTPSTAAISSQDLDCDESGFSNEELISLIGIGVAAIDTDEDEDDERCCVIQTGCNYHDFMKKDSNTTYNGYYKNVTAGGYIYDAESAQIITITGGDLTQLSLVAPVQKKNTNYDLFDSYFESVNIAFVKNSIEASTIEAFVNACVSIANIEISTMPATNYIPDTESETRMLGEVEETSSFANTNVYYSGTKQLVVEKMEVNLRENDSIKFRVNAILKDISEGEDMIDDVIINSITITTGSILLQGE